MSLQPSLGVLEEDPWRVAVVAAAAPAPAAPEPPPAVEPVPTPRERGPEGENGHSPAAPTGADQNLPAELAQFIQTVVNGSKTAVPMASLAQAVNREFGSQLSHTGWLGAGTYQRTTRVSWPWKGWPPRL